MRWKKRYKKFGVGASGQEGRVDKCGTHTHNHIRITSKLQNNHSELPEI